LFTAKSDLSWRVFSIAIANHLQLHRPSGAGAWSYNVLQRLTYLFVIFVLFPLVIWTGLAMYPLLFPRFRRPSLSSAASNPRARCTSSSPYFS
jgi:thiosulfate reductase cytochrome b subunit